jgi:hypothetical protein
MTDGNVRCKNYDIGMYVTYAQLALQVFVTRYVGFVLRGQSYVRQRCRKAGVFLVSRRKYFCVKNLLGESWRRKFLQRWLCNPCWLQVSYAILAM